MHPLKTPFFCFKFTLLNKISVTIKTLKMKTKSLSFLLVLFIAVLNAQYVAGQANPTNACSMSGIEIMKTTGVNPNPDTNGDITLDLYFPINIHNGGQKFIYIHFWEASVFPAAPFGGNGSVAPTSSGVLSNSIGTIALDVNTSNLSIRTTYPPDGSITPISTGFAVNRIGNEDFIYSLKLHLPQGGTSVKAAAWASQAGNGSVVHCSSGGDAIIVPLPVKFGDINATSKNGQLTVQWQSLNEVNSTGYTVEASKDGNNWVPIGTVQSLASNGNSSGTLDYSFFTSSLPISLAGLSIAFLLGAIFKSRIVRLIIAVVVVGAVVFSCSKDTNEQVSTDKFDNLYIRVASKDINQHINYSKVVKVQNL